MPNKAAKDADDTSKVLQAYEDANQKNKAAIYAARRHNTNLQKLYNKQTKKQPQTSSWSSVGSWPGFFSDLNFWKANPL